MVLGVGPGPAKHRDDRRVLTPFDIAGVRPPHTPDRIYRRLRAVTIVHNTDAWLADALPKLTWLQVEACPHRIQQIARPRIAVSPLPRFRPSNALHRLDSGLTALAALRKALEHVDAMEKASFICSLSRHD